MTDHKKALAADYHQAGKAAVEKYKAANPTAVGLKVRADVAAFKPRPKEMRNHAIRAVRLFLYDRSFLTMTNAEIAIHLSTDVPGYTAPANILTEQLSVADKRQIGAMLKEKGVTLNVAKLRSPSAVKRALRAYWAADRANACFDVKVTFTDAAVIVNGRAYPISGEGGRQRVRVGEGKLNLAALRNLLEL